MHQMRQAFNKSMGITQHRNQDGTITTVLADDWRTTYRPSQLVHAQPSELRKRDAAVAAQLRKALKGGN